jgi:hypothetical protein
MATYFIRASDGAYPTEAEIKAELLAVWDGHSPLSLGSLHLAYDNDVKLGEVGVDVREARACVGKYNSLIIRGPGRGPLVSISLAEAFLDETLEAIVQAVAKRSQRPD